MGGWNLRARQGRPGCCWTKGRGPAEEAPPCWILHTKPTMVAFGLALAVFVGVGCHRDVDAAETKPGDARSHIIFARSSCGRYPGTRQMTGAQAKGLVFWESRDGRTSDSWERDLENGSPRRFIAAVCQSLAKYGSGGRRESGYGAPIRAAEVVELARPGPRPISSGLVPGRSETGKRSGFKHDGAKKGGRS